MAIGPCDTVVTVAHGQAASAAREVGPVLVLASSKKCMQSVRGGRWNLDMCRQELRQLRWYAQDRRVQEE